MTTHEERAALHSEMGALYMEQTRLRRVLRKATARLTELRNETEAREARIEVRMAEIEKMLEDETVTDSTAKIPAP
jgi:predicted  nucleic acid-binding Zn-ribbon protein